MLQFEDVQFQLVELPAFVPRNEGEFVFQEGSVDLVHNSHGLIVMVNLGADPVRQLDVILAELAREPTEVGVKRKHPQNEIWRRAASRCWSPRLHARRSCVIDEELRHVECYYPDSGRRDTGQYRGCDSRNKHRLREYSSEFRYLRYLLNSQHVSSLSQGDLVF